MRLKPGSLEFFWTFIYNYWYLLGNFGFSTITPLKTKFCATQLEKFRRIICKMQIWTLNMPTSVQKPTILNIFSNKLDIFRTKLRIWHTLNLEHILNNLHNISLYFSSIFSKVQNIYLNLSAYTVHAWIVWIAKILSVNFNLRNRSWDVQLRYMLIALNWDRIAIEFIKLQNYMK